jgi:predicted kinase
VEAVILCGIQASGKTTFYRERFAATHERISLDDLKSRTRERAALERCLAQRTPFVVDNTNATKAYRAPYIAAARAAGFRVISYFFATEPKKALERNKQRTGKEVIPAAGLFATHKRLEKPTLDEGFDEIHVVEIVEAGRFSVTELRLPQ